MPMNGPPLPCDGGPMAGQWFSIPENAPFVIVTQFGRVTGYYHAARLNGPGMPDRLVWVPALEVAG